MNKKIFMFMLLIFGLFSLTSINIVSADNDDETWNVNYTYSGIDEAKQILSDKLDEYNTALVNSLETLQSKFKNNTDYLILKALGKINIGDINVKMLEQYFSIKTSLVSDYTTINSNFSILEEKKKYWLVSDTDYTSQKQNLNASVDAFFSKYLSLITGFNSTYSGDSGQVANFSGNITNLISSNQSILSGYEAQYSTMQDIVSKYKTFDTYVNQIKNLYDVNYDNLYNYISDVKDITAKDLESSLEKQISNYYSQYKNLEYYSGDISSYKDSTISSYKLEIDNFLVSLIKSFYTSDEYDFITNNYLSFKTTYMTGDDIDFNALVNTSLSGVYTKLNSTMEDVNANIKAKLNALNNPWTVNDVQTVLNQEVENYYKTNKQTKLDDFKSYLDKEVELMTYKTSSELDSYNVIAGRVSDAQSLTWEEKLAALKSLIDDISTFESGLIDQSLKSQSMKIWAQAKIDYIDAYIENWNFNVVAAKYGDIDSQLKSIMLSLEEDAKTKWKSDTLIGKVQTWIVNAEKLLAKDNVSSKNQYLILKIEKALIRFIYIK